MLTLRVVDCGATRTVDLGKVVSVVGRLPTSDLVLADPSVSRRHATIRVEGGRCFVQDVGSRFGTFVNDRQLVATEPEAAASAGDILKFGEVTATIEQHVAEQALLSEERDILDGPGTIYQAIADAAPATTALADSHLVKLIADLGRTLVTGQSLGDILKKVVDMAFSAVPADRAFLMLRESEESALEARVLRHRDGTVPDNPTLSRAVVRKVIRERVAICATDAMADPDLSVTDSIMRLNIRSFVCAPLWSGDAVMGVLYLDSPRRSAFAQPDLDSITALANAAAVAIMQSRLSTQLIEEQKRRERLQRYHSPSVVSRIIHQRGESAEPTAQERDVTVMFCDIVGFTALCEPLTPIQAAALLNTFLTRMTDVVFEHEGTLDKYLGDALLAVFGAPFEQKDHALKAVEAAIGMRRALVELNAGRDEAQKLRMRIAINSGVALTGDIGSPKRREFTVLGDVVNTASRIEGEVAEPGQIVIAASTYEGVKGRVKVRKLPSKVLRGKSSASDFYAVESQ